MFGVNQILMNQMQNNPSYKKVMDKIKECNNDPQSAFYSLAKEMGADPDAVLNQVKQILGTK